MKDNKQTNFIILNPSNADKLHELLQNLSEEATKWSMAPYKLEWVQRWLHTPNLIHIAAEQGDKITGFACIEEWTHPRRKHTGYLGAYIHRDHEGTELLPMLLQRVLAKAKEKRLHKINTEIVAAQKTTIKTLQENGFQIEGRKKDTFYTEDNQYYDTIILGKILEG